MAPEHPLVEALTTPEHRSEVEKYIDQARMQTDVERLSTEKEKTGVFTGARCVNRLTGERVPILVADYVLHTYGTGVVMGVPAHDQRDFEFARKYDIAVCHDGPYTEVAFDGYEPVSFLQADGAKEVGVEFHSLSKSFNMTGWRIGVVVGNELMVKALMTLKSNIDSGIPQAIQLMAIEALSGSQDCILEHNTIYQRRRDLVVEVLNKIGLEAQTPMASLYVWAKVPSGYTSASFAADLLEQVGVVVTPGLGYGPSGEGYVRLSLTVADASLVKGLSRLAGWRDDVNKFRIKVS